MGIELMLKAWILHQDSKFPGIHPIPVLVQELRCLVPSLAFTTKENKRLRIFRFVELRYPNRSSPVEIGEQDIEQIHGVADALAANARRTLMHITDCCPQEGGGLSWNRQRIFRETWNRDRHRA
jgi:hypothetical protein